MSQGNGDADSPGGRMICIYGIEFIPMVLSGLTLTKVWTQKPPYERRERLHQVFREPRGVVAASGSLEFSVFPNFVWQVGQNLVCGNTIGI